MLLNTLSPAIALLALSVEAATPRDAILLSKVRTHFSSLAPPRAFRPCQLTSKQVESLTLRGDRPTSHRRVPAIPQLRCVSDPRLCAKHPVDLMRCANDGAGWDGAEDVQWTCTAQLPPELRLGSTDVICEGYSGPDDPYVLRGSCGVEYALALTPEGEERWPDLVGGGGGGGRHRHGGDKSPSGGAADRWFGYLFWVIFVSVVGWIAFSLWRESQQARVGGGGGGARRAPRRNNGGGGGGGDGWDDPPPPYPGGGGNGRGYARKSGGSGAGGTSGGSNWQNNILSGAAGAAAGYYAGSRGRNSNNNGGYEGGGRGYGSTWGSGGAGPSRSGSGSSSSGSAASNSRYESTGFGSTSRR